MRNRRASPTWSGLARKERMQVRAPVFADALLARRCWDAGLAGFVLKSHYVPTAERAAVVNEALGGEVQVLGALALNASVGGMNPLAVEIAAREGARILWMPTVDAANHRAFGGHFTPGAQPPPW